MKVPKDNKNTKKIKYKFTKEIILQEIAIGKILGDGYISYTGNLNFCHSIKQKEYIEHCYELFKDFTRSGIKTQHRQRNNVPLTVLYFDTKAIFKEYINHFYRYDEINKKRIKIIPKNIYQLLTPRGLAYWIMDDGHFSKPNLELCTHSFQENEVNILKDVLENKFNLRCKILKEKTKDTNLFWYILTIKKESMQQLCNLVQDLIIPSMKYKINIK
jgi:hypothetical protein